MKHLKQYCQYIQNTGRIPLGVSIFDEDWEPIGPMVRKEMEQHELIINSIIGPTHGILLTEKGIEHANT